MVITGMERLGNASLRRLTQYSPNFRRSPFATTTSSSTNTRISARDARLNTKLIRSPKKLKRFAVRSAKAPSSCSWTRRTRTAKSWWHQSQKTSKVSLSSCKLILRTWSSHKWRTKKSCSCCHRVTQPWASRKRKISELPLNCTLINRE